MLKFPVAVAASTVIGPYYSRLCKDEFNPFLYGVSLKRDVKSEKFFMGELEHGERGVLDDYKSLLGLPSDEQVIEALKLLGKKKRVANKSPCPCNCGRRLGKCKMRLLISKYRNLIPRSWFKRHVHEISQMACKKNYITSQHLDPLNLCFKVDMT